MAPGRRAPHARRGQLPGHRRSKSLSPSRRPAGGAPSARPGSSPQRLSLAAEQNAALQLPTAALQPAAEGVQEPQLLTAGSAVTSTRSSSSGGEAADRELLQRHMAALQAQATQRHVEAQLAAMATLGLDASPCRSRSPSPSPPRSPDHLVRPASPFRESQYVTCRSCSPPRLRRSLPTGPHLPPDFAYRLMQIKSVPWDCYRLSK